MPQRSKLRAAPKRKSSFVYRKAGMTIRMEDGSLELVYATEDGYGDPDLGIKATNKYFLKYHPD